MGLWKGDRDDVTLPLYLIAPPLLMITVTLPLLFSLIVHQAVRLRAIQYGNFLKIARQGQVRTLEHRMK